MKLNLGCGKEILPGWINTDKFPMSKKIKKVDVTKLPLPFKDNQFSFIKMGNILEHLPIPTQLGLFDELRRISKPGGKIWIRVPFGSHWTRRIDHYRGYTYATFERIDSYWFGKDKRFKIVKTSDHPTKFGRLFPTSKFRKFLASLGIGDLFITDIIVVLKVLKG
jgi:predicted SAM-dependent methyltransferase